MGIGKDEFRAALARFPSGVTVVTTADADGRLHGLTVSAFCSVSLAPPMVLVCIEKTTFSHDALAAGEYFAVNVLAEGQEEISNRFASRSADKFADTDFRAGLGGAPVLGGALAALECRLAHAYDGGDHTIFVGLVEKSEIRDGAPLVYWHGSYRRLA